MFLLLMFQFFKTVLQFLVGIKPTHQRKIVAIKFRPKWLDFVKLMSMKIWTMSCQPCEEMSIVTSVSLSLCQWSKYHANEYHTFLFSHTIQFNFKAGNLYTRHRNNTDTTKITPTKILLSESISTKRHWPNTHTGTGTDTNTKRGFGACSDFCRCRLCIGHESNGLDLDKTHVVLTCSCQILARCQLPRTGLSLNN